MKQLTECITLNCFRRCFNGPQPASHTAQLHQVCGEEGTLSLFTTNSQLTGLNLWVKQLTECITLNCFRRCFNGPQPASHTAQLHQVCGEEGTLSLFTTNSQLTGLNLWVKQLTECITLNCFRRCFNGPQPASHTAQLHQVCGEEGTLSLFTTNSQLTGLNLWVKQLTECITLNCFRRCFNGPQPASHTAQLHQVCGEEGTLSLFTTNSQLTGLNLWVKQLTECITLNCFRRCFNGPQPASHTAQLHQVCGEEGTLSLFTTNSQLTGLNLWVKQLTECITLNCFRRCFNGPQPASHTAQLHHVCGEEGKC